MTKRSNFHLPQEIIIEILLQLPFDSILNCKLVSKQWKNIIKDRDFYKRYRDNDLAIFHSHRSNYSCVLLRHGNNNIAGTINGRHHPSFTVHSIHSINLRYPYTYFSEPSKGIACIYKKGSSNFLFRNLFTGESYTVPDIPLPLQQDFERLDWYCCGIGYDGFADDYKIVVAIYHNISSALEKENGLCWVYSFSNGGWKSLHGFPYAAHDWRSAFLTQCCSLNGVLHWSIVYLPEQSDKSVIVTYDLHTSRFGEMPVPPVAYDDFCFVRIAALGGKLCYLVHLSKFYYLWEMKEYGVSESWTLLCSIEYSAIGDNVFYNKYTIETKALYECGDGRKVVLFVCLLNGTLYLYDINNSEFKIVHQSTQKKRNLKQPKRKTREVET